MRTHSVGTSLNDHELEEFEAVVQDMSNRAMGIRISKGEALRVLMRLGMKELERLYASEVVTLEGEG